jgi:hypothetical protein
LANRSRECIAFGGEDPIEAEEADDEPAEGIAGGRPLGRIG